MPKNELLEALKWVEKLNNKIFQQNVYQALLTYKFTKLVKKLNLRSSNIGQDGIKEFKHSTFLTHLKHLDLGFNLIGHEGMKEFKQVTFLVQLRHLDLTYNQIGYSGMKELKEAIS